MTIETTSTSELSPLPPKLSGGSWKATLFLIVISVLGVLGIQAWSATSILSDTSALRTVLAEAHITAKQLEHRLGYGGLIHNFKNYVLRPDEENYRVAAMNDAIEALSLLDRIEQNSAKYGIEANLEKTHEMLNSYAQKLDVVRMYSALGASPQSIDEQVRFDDKPALKEVSLVLAQLDQVIDKRLIQLHDRGLLTSLLSTVSTAALGILLIAIVIRRQRRYNEALGSFAENLTASNEQLAKANVSLSQFAGIVSHDLKTPIRFVNTFNKMIVEDIEDSQAIEQHVEHIDQQVQRMDAIIDSLLDFTKLGFTKPHIKEIDVISLFDDVEESVRPEMERHNARVEFIDELYTPVLADPMLVRRVFISLMNNSLKYTSGEERTQIAVRAVTDGKQALFSVSDNGIGIDARFATKIFEPMTRLHSAQSRYKGVGIGLSLAKTIIENHDGLIWLDEKHTPGTRVVFSLPLAQFAEQKKAA